MGLWDKMKSNTKKLKLQGEVQLLQRDITSKKKKFGVELYDLLTNDKNKLLGISAGTLFKGQQEELKEPFERARDDIASIRSRKDIKQRDLDVLEVKGAHTLPDYTMGQKVNKAGRAISNGAKGTKLQAEMALLDREIKVRKEQFGVEVFDLAKESEEKKTRNPVKQLSNAISNLSQQEKDIQTCIDKAKDLVATVESTIRSKQTEIHSLDEEMEPMMSEGRSY
eukprot:Nitzschia sp. Nitz4//scaffold28_size193895//135550//136221//NITZ4_001675-RA/size193895-processed-gene-0.233-mRNA-1//1//CDS//3329546012//994//frame0